MIEKLKHDEYMSLFKRSIEKINTLNAQLKANNDRREPVAIVGMGCRFPGGCDSPQAFWQFLTQAGDGVITVPEERWPIDFFYDPVPQTPGKIYLKEAGFLKENVKDFDARFFGISPREAAEMDPQQRLLLEVTWEALEYAGIAPDGLRGTQTGVFIGIIGSEYGILPRKIKKKNPYTLTGTMSNIASGRISHFLGVHGPSISLDTACSSSLVAVHLASESLQRGESTLAIAGGVNLMLSPEGFLSLCELNALARDGRCKTFSADGDGYGRGEGCGIVILKRLSRALKDRDSILAVIKGTGINQDGPGSGLTVPNGQAQKAVMSDTLRQAGCSTDDISYFELHGTGTPLGDPIEFQALYEVFGKEKKRQKPLYMGSVKSNIGHLEAAAGIASLIKVVMCLQNKKIPAGLHLKKINPRIHLDKIPARIPQDVIAWKKTGKERVAGINSFGFSGTNTHAIISEAPQDIENTDKPELACKRPVQILALSAKDDKALSQLVDRFKDFFENHTTEQLANVCFTANFGRMHFSNRTAFIAESWAEMKKELALYKVKPQQKPAINDYKRVFAFNNASDDLLNQQVVKVLYETQPTFRNFIIQCDKVLQHLAQIQLLINPMTVDFTHNSLSEKCLADIVLFILYSGWFRLLESWGIKANVLLGVRVGEYAAAIAGGIMELEMAFGLILKHYGVTIRSKVESLLKKPRLRIVSGWSGKEIEKGVITSIEYWEGVLDQELKATTGLEYLVKLGCNQLIEIVGQADNSFNNSLPDTDGISYFQFSPNESPWQQLVHLVKELYCLGIPINWDGYEAGYTCQKVRLPSYPFQKKSFWSETGSLIEHYQSRYSTDKNDKRSEHFEDGTILNSPLKEKQIIYRLSLDKVPELSDTHGVLHVGYFFEMIARAVKKLYQQSFIVKKIDFLSALVVSTADTVEVSLVLSRNANLIAFTFYSCSENNNWTKRTEGLIELLENEPDSFEYPVAIADLKQDCAEEYSGDEFYQRLQKRGLDLGKSVQWVESVWAREGEVLAHFHPDFNQNPEHHSRVHPGVFDACAQLFHAALFTTTARDMKFMVTRWEDLIYNEGFAGKELWCHVQLHDKPQRADTLIGFFTIFDGKGQILARISNGMMKGFNKERENAFKKIMEQTKENEAGASGHSAILVKLSETKQAKWKGLIYNALTEIFAVIFDMPVTELELDEPLMDMGMDSLMGLESKAKIEKEFSIFLPLEILIQGPSIKELTEAIIPLLSIKSLVVNTNKKKPGKRKKINNIINWIVHRKVNPAARIKLFCLPYGSGGGASLYRHWQEHLPEYIEVCPIQLPGKENRIKEKAFIDIEQAVDVLQKILQPELDRPYAFYGHSMGALIAFRIAYNLWCKHENKPKHLFVGAYSSPTIIPNPFLEFTRELFQQIGYGDIPGPDILTSLSEKELDEIVDVITSESDISNELVRLLLPTRLAELKMVESYTAVDEPVFDIPITAFHGKKDDKVTVAEISGWQELTTNDFLQRELSGDHLFLVKEQNQEQLLNFLAQDLEKYK